jgi:eukaryotic-like serine/threonine-protein kinase
VSGSAVLDRAALSLLDDLLQTAEPQREQRLSVLAGTDPPLHARVLALLRAGAIDSQALAGPVRDMAAIAAPPAAPGPVAGWRLLRELGQGGMASVWLAERSDGGLARQAAIKRPLGLGGSAGQRLAERFARERDMLAALDHPHIARLFDAGVAADGQGYLVLEHVEGLPITAYAEQAGLSRRQRIEVFLQVLDAVDHAHRHLVVHRDLKPANILVTPDGRAKLLDFGIAKLLGPGQATLTQGALMTPLYAAPEQVLGPPQQITTACDVYSAGVVLYELLTGRLPLAAMNAADPTVPHLMHAIAEADPAPPGLGTDLDTVLLKALQKAPADRYASAERFADDLRRLLADRPILARPVPVWRRLVLLLRRQRRLAAVGGVALALLLASAVYGWQQRQATLAEEARTAAVRDFMFTIVRDAEPDETSPAGEVTGRNIVDAAVLRARQQFEGAPLLRGEVLLELGRIYGRLDADDAALATLTEAAALLERAGPGGAVPLHKVRGHLASLLADRDPAAGRALAAQVLAGCTADSEACARARLYAHWALARIEAGRGAAEASVAQGQEAVRESLKVPGAPDSTTVEALELLAVLQRNAGQLAAAGASADRAAAIATGQVVRAGIRSRLERTQATLRLDLGAYADAAARFEVLAAQARSGPDRALALRMLARARLALGQPEAAQQAADAAWAIAEPAGDHFEAAFALQERARAASLRGQDGPAEMLFAAAARRLPLAGFGPETTEAQRFVRQHAEHALRQGRLDAAQALLAPLTAGPPLEQAQRADLAGRLALAGGDRAAAQALHRQAAGLLERVLPEDHPLRRRNRLYLRSAEDDSPPQAAQDSARSLF